MRKLMSCLMFALVLLSAAHAAASSPILVTSASHEGVWTNDTVEWRSQFDPEHVPSHSGVWRIDFAVPISADATIRAQVPSTVVEPVRNQAGEVVAVELSSESAAVSTALVTSLSANGPPEPPLARDAVQRVDVVGVAVKPPPGSPLELRLADVRHIDLDTADRRRLQQRWGRPRSARPIILIADHAFVTAGGLSPALQAEDRSQVLVLLGIVLFVLMILLVVGMRFVSSRVRHEEADAFLRKHEPTLADL